VPLAVVLAVLAVPATASAHSRRPAVALDYRLSVPAAPFAGVHARVLDGDRELRLTVVAPTRLVVRGLLGEPMLRWDPRGVWLNQASPTAQADKLARAGQHGWRLVASGRTFAWHDHRLSPPHIAAGGTGRFSLPVTLDGRARSIPGVFTHVRRPSLWPWLLVAATAGAALVAAARVAPRRGTYAVGLAAVAAVAALTATAGFTLGDPISGGGQWFELACTALLGLGALGALRLREPSTRSWAACVIGAVSVAFALPSLGVFWHGVVVSSLAPTVVRALEAIAVIAGLGAAGFGLAAAGHDEAAPKTARGRSALPKGAR
jgi:hypothetical protein